MNAAHNEDAANNAEAAANNANLNFGVPENFNYPEDEEDDDPAENFMRFPNGNAFRDFVGRYFIYNVNDRVMLDHIFIQVASRYTNRNLTLRDRETMLTDLREANCTINNNNRVEFIATFNVPDDRVRILMHEGGRRRRQRKSRRKNRRMRNTRRR